jgi:CARDB
MARISFFTGHRCKLYRHLFICISLLFLLWGCGDNPSGQETIDNPSAASSAGGSASFAIRWHSATTTERASNLASKALDDCGGGAVSSIICNVYDESSNLIASGGPFQCADHHGIIENIPAGSGRMIAALGWSGENGDGGIVYQGQTENPIIINPGEITEVGTIEAFAFVPTLHTPDNNAQVNPTKVSLEWEPLENADEYLVQIAEDDTFESETIIVHETTPATAFAPENLEPSKKYFWKIAAIDFNNNVGADSEVRSFVTSDAAVISGYIRTSAGDGITGVTVTFSNGGGTATTDSSGAYSKTIDYGWSGTATPSANGYIFEPSSISFENVSDDQTGQSFTGIRQTGSLQVSIAPDAAIKAGAQWRVDGGPWRNSGYTQDGLAVGNHTVEFGSISGWSKPGSLSVTITNNNTTAASGTYTQQTGSLQVTIAPDAAIKAGAQWRVDGGPWRNSGDTQDGLAVGNHTVEFGSISGWSKPGSLSVTITNNNTTVASGTYTQQRPDLVISTGSPAVRPSTTYPGGSVTLSGWTVKNQGNAASGDIYNGFYLSQDSIITASDTYLDGNQNTSLGPGEAFNWGGPTLTIPQSTGPGIYFIGILVDSNNSIAESNESNNYVSVQINVEYNVE